MVKVRQLVTRAFRYLGLASEGQPAPAAYDADVALQALKGLYVQYMASGAFGALTDVLISAAYTANENERVINVTVTDFTVSLPDSITDACGTVRAVYDKSVVIVAGGSSFLYDADQAAWQEIEALTLDSTAPLAQRLQTGLAALLAAELAAEYRVDPSPVLAALATEGARQLRLSRRLEASIDPGLQVRNRSNAFSITNG